jgi:hypothetical protein
MYGTKSMIGNRMNATNRLSATSSFLRGSDKSALLPDGHRKEKSNLIKERRPSEEMEDELIGVSHLISEADAYDYGYYTVMKKNKEDNKVIEIVDPTKSLFQNTINNTIQNIGKFHIHKLNLLRTVNELEYDERTGEPHKIVKNDKELIYRFAREENDYKNFDLPSKDELRKKLGLVTIQGGMNGNRQNLEEIQQTYNSFVVKKQSYELSQNNVEHAAQLNFEYQKRKDRFEINLIYKLLKKYENSTKPGTKIVVDHVVPFQELKRESVKLLDKWKKASNIDKMFMNNIRIEAQSILVNFIKRIEKEVDDTPTKNNELEMKKFRNYAKWKKKISELTNIWDLFQSNGIDIKFPFKYLILKKYFAIRATRRQKEADGNIIDDNKNNIFYTIYITLFGTVNSKFIPKSILMPGEVLNILIEIFISICLVYSLFSIPVEEFLGMTSKTMTALNKFIDVFFYIEIVFNFRRVYRDKANEFVYDLHRIMRHYISGIFIIDFFSTIPWYFFFITNGIVFRQIKTWVMCFKVMRVVKLATIFNKLESLKWSNYTRLIKLICLFFFFAHWLGCLLYSSVDVSLAYSGLQDSCYVNNLGPTKDNINFECRYFMSIYNAAYIIPGQYTSAMSGLSLLAPSSEYGMYVMQYMIGQVLSAYIFGGMASTIQNLNQGQTFFSNKMDMLNQHMSFYEVDRNTMKDVKIYFDYIWQRHKDVIYGKYHFDLLSKSLREKFERLNLPGNEILLAKFYNLNPGNTKLIGNILMNLSKTVLFPYEILFDVGSVIRGVYILLNGDITLANEYIKNVNETDFSICYADIITEIQEKEKRKELSNLDYYDEKDSIVFPLVSSLIKTGRNWQRCFSANFTDLLFLPIEAFDELIFNFPIEMHILKHKTMEWVHQKKLFENNELFKILSKHSSRSTSKYFLKEFDKISIWIPIPIPISQRKIAGNYIDTFTKKVRNQWREILLIGDLNMCLNSYHVIGLIKNRSKKKGGEKDKKVSYNDPLDNIKDLIKEIDRMTEKYIVEFEV